MQPVLTTILAKRRDRAIAIMLGVKEREADSYLPPEVSARLRKVILDQVNELTDLMVDLAASFDTGTVVLNEHYLTKLDEVHRAVITSD